MLAFTADGFLLVGGAPARRVLSPYGRGLLGPANLKGIVLHYTAGGSAESSARFMQENAASVSAHFIVDRDGTIIQGRAINSVANHAGRSSYKGLHGLNQYSLGIEISNRGYSVAPVDGWVRAAHKNAPDWFVYWEPYPDAQIAAVRDLCAALCVACPSIAWIAGHDDVAPVRKIDPGPLLPIRMIRDFALSKRSESGGNEMTVTADDGLYLRSRPDRSSQALALLPDGTTVRPMSRVGDWVQVTTRNRAGKSITGFVHKAFIE